MVAVNYAWKNTSETAADFVLTLNGTDFPMGKFSVVDGEQGFLVPVAEGMVIDASIVADGVTIASFAIPEVDCEPTIPEITIPNTTIPGSTVPDSTVPVTIPEPGTTIPGPDMTVPMSGVVPVGEAIPVVPFPPTPATSVPADSQLPVTGSTSNEMMLAALGILLTGTAVTIAARRV